jgi:hypothetical protein
MITVCATAKGGQGCSTVAALLALVHPPAGIVDLTGDIPAILGLRQIDPRDTHGLTDLLVGDGVVDRAAIEDLMARPKDGLLLVPRGTVDPHLIAPQRWAELDKVLDESVTRWIVDAGMTGLLADARERLLVTRHCFLALRAAKDLTPWPDKVITVREPGRALPVNVIELALEVPVAATLDVDPAIARAVDGGLLTVGVPDIAVRALEGVAI